MLAMRSVLVVGMGADVSVVVGHGGRSPLSLAVQHCCGGTVKLLLDRGGASRTLLWQEGHCYDRTCGLCSTTCDTPAASAVGGGGGDTALDLLDYAYISENKWVLSDLLFEEISCKFHR